MGGTHPTGMHSCCYYDKVILSFVENWAALAEIGQAQMDWMWWGWGMASMPRLLRQFGFGTTSHTQRQNKKAFQSLRGRARSCTLRSKLNMSGSCTRGGETGARYLYRGPDLGLLYRGKGQDLIQGSPLHPSLWTDRQNDR